MNNDLITRFTAIYENSGMTKTTFSQRIGVSRQQLRMYLNGTKPISAKTILRVCKEFGVKKEWLIEGSGEMTFKIENIAEEQEMQHWFMKDAIGEIKKQLADIEARLKALEDANKSSLSRK